MRRSFLPLAIVALAAYAQADTTLTASLESSVQINNGLFAFQSADGSDQGAAGLDTILAGVPYSGTATVAGDLTDYLTYRYTVVGTYGPANDGLVIGLNPLDAGNAVGKSFTEVFGTGMTESSLVSSIKSAYKVFNGTASLGDYLNAGNVQTFLTNHKPMLEQGVVGGSLISFSDGAVVGTLVATPVPEPASMAALGLGALAMLRCRKSR